MGIEMDICIYGYLSCFCFALHWDGILTRAILNSEIEWNRLEWNIRDIATNPPGHGILEILFICPPPNITRRAFSPFPEFTPANGLGAYYLSLLPAAGNQYCTQGARQNINLRLATFNCWKLGTAHH